ncbi:ribosome maturation factor RimP [Hathewaya histolytica]|uniref:Ribosome maturation factor RimP n=1 Tax=Hathewaya histolytica TaxID=1498 RepID=A0A4V6KD92_HATHI|nr:ribosome maturation factor RimP [Hathewaya histolytica]VTQ89557.1 clustered with transcription termination protein NusA [Hathewaya histolytica]
MNETLIAKLTEVIKPLVINEGYELYHLEFVKEGGEDYLRVYIDNNNGITLDDCVKINKVVSDALDIEDPIPGFYYLEISSPGLDRVLHTEEHLNRYLNSTVNVKLRNLIQGKKILEGILKGFNSESVMIVLKEEEISLNRNNIISITLKGEY